MWTFIEFFEGRKGLDTKQVKYVCLGACKTKTFLQMTTCYYVPVYANWEGDILPTRLGNGTVAFHSPGYAPFDERLSKLNASLPAYWMAVQAVTPIIYQNKYFVVLGEHNTIVDAHVPGSLITPAVIESQSDSIKDQSLYTRFGPVYSLFGLGLLLYVVHRLR